MKTDDNKHSIDLETTELPVIKTLLGKLQVNEDIEYFRLEMKSESPITAPPEQEQAEIGGESAEIESEPDPEPEQVADEPDPDPEPDPEPEQVADDLEEEPESSSPTDVLLGDPPTKILNHDKDPEDYLNDAEYGEYADAYLEAADDLGEEEVDPYDFVGTPIKEGTQKWKITAILYRNQGLADAREIANLLEDTDWEIPYASVSATLTPLTRAGVVQRVEKEDKRAGQFQLTQLGRDAMRKMVEESDEYPLTVADKITGVHPTNQMKATA